METDFDYLPAGVRRVAFIDWYEIHDRSRLESVLTGLDDVEAVGDGEWDWHETRDGERQRIAALTFEGDGGTLSLAAEREADAERCGAILVEAARGALEFMIGEERYAPIEADATAAEGADDRSVAEPPADDLRAAEKEQT